MEIKYSSTRAFSSLPILGGVPKGRWYAFAFLLLAPLFISATYDEVLTDKQKQTEVIQKQIDASRKEITSYNKELEIIRRSIDSLDASMLTLNTFLKDYQNVSYLTPEQIAIEANMTIFLAEEVDRLQQSFRNKIINLYKRGKNYELELLMSSKTPNEYLRRNEYLERFAKQRKKDLRELESKQMLLDEKKKMLSLSTSSQRFYVEQKRGEKARLDEVMNSLIQKKSQAEFSIQVAQERIEVKEQELANIRSYISNLELNKESYKGVKTPRLSTVSESFELSKGALNLPVEFALLRNQYGETINNATGTRSFNNGIDFSIAYGSRIYALMPGTVTLVGDAPFYGKTIIITHDRGYRTVYSSFSEVLVKPGDMIKLNQIIGRTGENPDGQSLHFEIWKDRASLNPKEWVRF